MHWVNSAIWSWGLETKYFGKLWNEMENIPRKFLDNGRKTHLQVNVTILYFVMVGMRQNGTFLFESGINLHISISIWMDVCSFQNMEECQGPFMPSKNLKAANHSKPWENFFHPRNSQMIYKMANWRTFGFTWKRKEGMGENESMFT